MSVYAMILTGVMIGNGPEMVSEEVEERLHFDGRWEGTIGNEGSAMANSTRLCLLLPRNIRTYRVADLIDEGRGRFHILRSGSVTHLGIYEQHDDLLRFCISDAINGRPIDFEDGQHLLILHRVKPGK